MKKCVPFLLIACLALFGFSSCGKNAPEQTPYSPETPEVPAVDKEKIGIPEDLIPGANTLSVGCTEGTDGCWVFDGSTLRFSEIDADTVCTVSGTFNGNIVIDAGDDYRFTLELWGTTLYDGTASPLTVLSGDKVTLTAKKETENFIYDTRPALTDEEEEPPYAVFSESDLLLGGKGELTVISATGKGVHSKKDLSVKNLTLSVCCEDNALKGNDSVTVSDGTLTLISRTGDGIKTENTDLSSSGKQRGIVSLTGCAAVTVYAGADGIDASYNAEIGEDAVLNVYTGKYSPYSSDRETETSPLVPDGQEPFSPGSELTPPQRENGGTPGGFPGNDPGGRAGLGGNFPGRGGPERDFPGQMTDGNTEKSEGSAKGIKAGNEILVTGGTVSVCAEDDALHANADGTLENGSSPTGNVTVGGGLLSLYTDDDAIHADGMLTVTDGKIDIGGCYEGLEGNTVRIGGGDISVVARDDGINATAVSGTGIAIAGGTLYVYAGGDGLDANSRSAYEGVVFSGGDVIVISTSGGDSSIDTEQGYSYTGGRVLALCPSGGMGNEAANCRNFSSVASKAALSLKAGQRLSVTAGGKTALSAEMPCAMQALAIYLGAADASFTAE